MSSCSLPSRPRSRKQTLSSMKSSCGSCGTLAARNSVASASQGRIRASGKSMLVSKQMCAATSANASSTPVRTMPERQR